MRSCLVFVLATLALAWLAFPIFSTARTWYVPADAPTIQAGIDSATTGDVVEIACGVYCEYDIQVKPGIT